MVSVTEAIETIETTDPDTARQIVAAQYTSVRFETEPGHTFLRLTRHALGPLSIDRLRFDMTIQGGADPLPTFLLIRTRRGTFHYKWGHTEQTFGPARSTCPSHQDANSM